MKNYFSYKKANVTFLFTSCASAISHALKNGIFNHIQTKDDLYFEIENLFVMKTEDEAKESGNYELVD